MRTVTASYKVFKFDEASEEAIIETIEANDYEFKEDGSIE